MTTQRTRIAYMLTPITFGGSEKVNLNFLRTVDRSRFDIHPILLVRPWEEESFFAQELRHHGYEYSTVPVAVKTSGDRLRVLRVVRRIYRLLKDSSFDLVHTHGYFADICGIPVARMLKVHSVSTCHGFISNDRRLRVYNALDMFALRWCQRIIAVSEGIRSDLVRSGIRESRIAVIQNAVDSPRREKELPARRDEKRRSLSIRPGEHVVGYVGRLSEEKGLNYLIEAASVLSSEALPVKVLIVGDGPERAALEHLVTARGLEKKVIFAGFQRDVEDWLPALDVFALPSLTEGTPMALLEAMAMGVPVIATAVGGVPKVVVDGINGLLVAPGDSHALSEGIRSLQRSPERAMRLTYEGMNTIKTKYDIGSWCRSIESHYDCFRGEAV